jgi:hypothetical protein
MRGLRCLAMGPAVARPSGEQPLIRTFQVAVLSSPGTRIIPGLRDPLPNMLISCWDSSFDCRSSISYRDAEHIDYVRLFRVTARRTAKNNGPFQRVPVMARAMAESERYLTP